MEGIEHVAPNKEDDKKQKKKLKKNFIDGNDNAETAVEKTKKIL